MARELILILTVQWEQVLLLMEMPSEIGVTPKAELLRPGKMKLPIVVTTKRRIVSLIRFLGKNLQWPTIGACRHRHQHADPRVIQSAHLVLGMVAHQQQKINLCRSADLNVAKLGIGLAQA